ncbi:MAG: trypsin-like peptidase domain-containing protein [Actinomycetaceae bacterium]|nr:trypsin-like peptidase domain-containing protein [Actinomycetaceae bacterium]
MKKKYVISLFALVAIVGGVFGVVTPQAQAAGRMPDTHGSTVQLWINHYNTACSGVFVAPDLILTAKHCVVFNVVNPQTNKKETRTETHIKVYNSHAGTGTPIAVAEVKWTHPGETKSNPDVALLKTTNYRTNNYAPVARATPHVGETVQVCGVNNLDKLYQGYEGNYCGTSTVTEHTSYPTNYILSQPLQLANGDSGGPVYNSRGQVVGIIHGDDHSSNFATSLQHIIFKLRVRGVVVQ